VLAEALTGVAVVTMTPATPAEAAITAINLVIFDMISSSYVIYR